jgi:predicted PurR-regulated permease PerM
MEIREGKPAIGRNAYAGPLILLGIFLGGYFLLKLSPPLTHVFFLGVFSIVVAAMMDIPVSFMSRWMPRWTATVLLVGALALGIFLVVSLAAPALADQGSHILDQAAAALERLQAWGKHVSRSPIMDSMGGKPLDVTKGIRNQMVAFFMNAVPLAFGSVAVGAEIFAIIVIAAFIAVRPADHARDIIRLFPKEKEARLTAMFSEMGEALRHWTFGTLFSMTVISTIIGIGLMLLGIKGWLILAVITFFGEFIPFAGPVLSAIPALAVGLGTSTETFFYVGALFLATQQLEGNIVQPLVMKTMVHIRPPVLILWQLLFALAFGFMGLLVATPLLAMVHVAVDRGYIKGVLGRR